MHKHSKDYPTGQGMDMFYTYIQETIGDYPVKVDERCWQRIDRHLSRKRVRQLTLRMIYSGVAVVALSLLVFSFSTMMRTEEQPLREAGIRRDDAFRSETMDTIRQKVANQPFLAFDGLTGKQAVTVPPVKKRSLVPLPTVYTENKTDAVDEPVKAPESAIAMQKQVADSTVTVNKTSPSVSAGKRQRTFYTYEKKLPVWKEKSGYQWALTASLATAHSNPGEINVCGEGEKPPLPESDAITNLSFDPPFSIGILLHKDLNRTFGLETGLMYSYLSTSYRDMEYTYKANLNLHYLGFPVTLTMNIWRIDRRWALYATAGVMVEKGLRSELTRQLLSSDEIVVRRDGIGGWQWSTNASVGISYRLTTAWHVYAEPKVSYYFDNDQPVSIRTEKQVVPGISAGIRYAF